MLQSPETSSWEKTGVTMLEVSAVAQEGCKLESYHGSSEMPAAVESVSRPNGRAKNCEESELRPSHAQSRLLFCVSHHDSWTVNKAFCHVNLWGTPPPDARACVIELGAKKHMACLADMVLWYFLSFDAVWCVLCFAVSRCVHWIFFLAESRDPPRTPSTDWTRTMDAVYCWSSVLYPFLTVSAFVSVVVKPVMNAIVQVWFGVGFRSHTLFLFCLYLSRCLDIRCSTARVPWGFGLQGARAPWALMRSGVSAVPCRMTEETVGFLLVSWLWSWLAIVVTCVLEAMCVCVLVILFGLRIFWWFSVFVNIFVSTVLSWGSLSYNYQKIFIPALNIMIHWWWVQLYLRELISNFLGLDLFRIILSKSDIDFIYF